VIDLHAPVTLITLASNDSLTINAGGGDDNVAAASILAGSFKLTENGEAGNDTLTGSRGNDTLNGGEGDDEILGFRGNDLALMGAGSDTFEWDPGDGNDTVEGQGGHDTMLFNGSNDAENFDLSDSGTGSPFHRVRFTRDVGTVIMDLNEVETINLNPFGGADTVTVNDQTATDIFSVNVDLSGSAGTGDGQADAVVINGTNGDDDSGLIQSFGTRITANVSLFPLVNITGEEAANDTLTVNALGGNDTLDASFLQAGLIKLTVNGGAGNDTITTGEDNTLIDGGPQTDTINANGNVTVLPSSGDDAVNVNIDGIGVANVTFPATQRIGQLNINSGGVATLASGGAKVLTITGLVVAGSGRLDLTDNDLILDYSTLASPISGIRSLLASGFHGGAWDGNGINSSSAALTPGTALGFAEATDLFSALPANFDGQSIDNSTLVVRYTRNGDANLDRKVNALDFNALASNFGGTSRRWTQGDFNFDTVVSALDFSALAVNFNSSLPSTAAAASTRSDPPPPSAARAPGSLFSIHTIRNPVDALTTADPAI
jgi:hypothetical protein